MAKSPSGKKPAASKPAVKKPGTSSGKKAGKSGVGTQHAFRDMLLLNQWLISLFGVDPLEKHEERPFRRLAEPIRDPLLEGMDANNLHRFYLALGSSPLFVGAEAAVPGTRITRAMLLAYEENIVRHTQAINARRARPVVWKYFQWLSLLFVEIYLDRYFGNRAKLLADLNAFVGRFNDYWGGQGFAPVPGFQDDDLNKLCLQNATGSGKTLLMHVNLLQYRHYAKAAGRESELSRTILITPNESLSAQHVGEFHGSGISAQDFMASRGDLLGASAGLARVDVLEITKLADQSGPNTLATRDLGDQNLLLVDEGHRGMSGTEEGVWFTRRSALCARGFTFEYSATFEQAVRASKNAEFENAYARAVIFDYSYRWFYEDGFGKDYQIINLPNAFETVRRLYMTACLLKYYQQLRIYQEQRTTFDGFHVEKPLWVFVGNTVSAKLKTDDEKTVATDVAQIVEFVANFLGAAPVAIQDIGAILTGNGNTTGLLDGENDIFADAFPYLKACMGSGETASDLYDDILNRVFNHAAGGHLSLLRITGESGEIALRAGMAREPFGLINVGDAKGLCDHVAALAAQSGANVTVDDSDFTEAMFASVKESSSPVNLLIGSKKFVEGWDCWRVSTMGLMHVGKSEGAQIIQLFGRGVRLKGHGWGLKRSSSVRGVAAPKHIGELETLNVFGIEANFMEKFRDFLEGEGLPGGQKLHEETIPLAVTHDFGKKLKVIRPRRKRADGEEYDFLRDGPSVTLDANVPDALKANLVEVDWFPRIQTLASQSRDAAVARTTTSLDPLQQALLDTDGLYFDLEAYKQQRGWHNLNVSRTGIRDLLARNDWYTLYLPESLKRPGDFNGVRQLQQVAAELLKRYAEKLYRHAQRAYIEPRLEVRELTPDDENLPQADAWRVIVDASDEVLIKAIKEIKEELATQTRDYSVINGRLEYSRRGQHLYEPLLHAANRKITVQPVALNESEFRFVRDLQDWCGREAETLKQDGAEIFLLRNLSRGKGVGFFEAGNFHPDFILWVLKDGRQHIAFIEPHGLRQEGPGSDKLKFYLTIKDIEKRLREQEPENADLTLNSVILSPTRFADLKWDLSREELEQRHVLFMQDDRDAYIGKLYRMVCGV